MGRGFCFAAVVRVLDSEERAALNFLADANSPGVRVVVVTEDESATSEVEFVGGGRLGVNGIERVILVDVEEDVDIVVSVQVLRYFTECFTVEPWK